MHDSEDYKILHLEDDPNDAELVEAALRIEGVSATIKVVSNQAAFLKALDKGDYDVILLDCSIPDMTTEDVLDALRLHNTVPAIIVSGNVGDEQAVHYIKMGAVDYVLKDNLVRLPNTIIRAVQEQRIHIKAQEQALTQKALVNSTNAGLFKIDMDGSCLYANKQMTKMTGFTKTALMDNGWIRCVHEEDKEEKLKLWEKKLRQKHPFEIEGRIKKAHGGYRWVKVYCEPAKKGNNVTGYYGTLIDITEFKEIQQKLEDAARVDFLTQLPNRLQAHETLTRLLELLKRNKIKSISLLYIDLDNFKKINDTLGHHVGDELLQKAALRFKDLLRYFDFIARVGGDEFVIISEDIKDVYDINLLAQRLINSFQKPFLIEKKECLTTVSIGIMHISNADTDFSAIDIMKHADQAMYWAKAHGRNRAEFYTDKLNEKIHRIVQMENDIRQALKKNEFSLVYQPQINIKTNKIMGCEVLIRWKPPDKDFIAPDEFIQIAEEAHLIEPISDWVISTALEQFSHWCKSYPKLFNLKQFLSINLSAIQLEPVTANNIIEKILSEMNSLKLNTKILTLEITETAVMENIDTAQEILNEFNRLGLSISIDDFGTGYSSLSYLKALPISFLKIDKSFIDDLNNAGSQAITRGIISVANALNIKVIAEGVETKEQHDFLLKHGCFCIQGYYIARPMPAEEFKSFVLNYSRT